ncbi:hypothetical protein BGX38DRAFT_166595 [Terfezia claveryi]|nr:hypothetical protein BGX38DRAFT_166595 [Terfezia claveryi]
MYKIDARAQSCKVAVTRTEFEVLDIVVRASTGEEYSASVKVEGSCINELLLIKITRQIATKEFEAFD